MPTQQHPRLLIVEGESDRSFFEALLRRLKLDVAIHVVVPRDLSATPNDLTRNTKQGVIKRLDSQVRRLSTGNLLALGVVIDADQPAQGGFDATRTLAAKALEAHGFDAPTASGQSRCGDLACLASFAWRGALHLGEQPRRNPAAAGRKRSAFAGAVPLASAGVSA